MGKANNKKKIKKQNLKTPSSPSISQVLAPKDDYLSISYRYFINEYFSDKKFNNHFKNSEHCGEFMHNVHLLLKEPSNKKKSEILNKGYQSQMNIHPLEGRALSIFLSIAKNLRQIDESNIYQVKANSVSGGRVVFYIHENTIFVLLYDPNHLLYRMDKHGAKEAVDYSYSPIKSSS